MRTNAQIAHILFLSVLILILLPLWLPLTALRLAWSVAEVVEDMVRTEPP
jgi:hypothetical protein